MRTRTRLAFLIMLVSSAETIYPMQQALALCNARTPRPLTNIELRIINFWLITKLQEIRTHAWAPLTNGTIAIPKTQETNYHIDLLLDKSNDILRDAISFGFTDIVRFVLALLQNNIIADAQKLHLPPQPFEALLITRFEHERTYKTLLHIATAEQKVDIVGLLLEYGADPNTPDTYRATPLHTAAARCAPKLIKILLAHGARIDAQDQLGRSPLHVAAAGGDNKTVAALLSNHAQINIRNNDQQTPLHIASRFNHLPTASLLLDYGADPALQDDEGKTPLELAFHHHPHTALTSLLIGFLSKSANQTTTERPLKRKREHP